MNVVPSLYVRVYRLLLYLPAIDFGSLTIREGISLCHAYRRQQNKFPHYTYVRVYRKLYMKAVNDCCSLTIREGISEQAQTVIDTIGFPHKM